MRIIFSVLGLLVVVAIIGMLARHELQTARVIVPADGAASETVLSGTPAQQSKQVQRQVTDDINKALQQGMQRNADADAKQ